MSKHTPGPWTVTADGAGWYIECAPERGHSVAYIRAEIGEGDPDTSDDEKEANASLIAAAPGLLEALRMWMEIHEKPAGFAGKYGKALDAAIHTQQVKVDAAAAAARAAIAKATGGAA